ncbi:MAG: hypothetical protein KDJ17_00885 [Hyphomicrobiaceae bacterium]|nr:hypothetical protein [Hyphomicrobiaceae bacterium]
MSFKIGARRSEPDAGSIVEHGSHGGLFATILSALALVISGMSYYESTLRTAELSVYVPPMIHYARDGEGDVFNVPITIANDGARTGTVLAMELDAENLRADAPKKSARFYSAFLGDYPKDDTAPNRSFAPLSIPGHGTFTETVRFYPMSQKTKPYVVDDKGDYRFTLKLITVKPDRPDLVEQAMRTDPQPLTFQMRLPFISDQHLEFRRGTIAMTNTNWQPAVSKNSEPALSSSTTREAAPADQGSDTTPDAAEPSPGEDAK